MNKLDINLKDLIAPSFYETHKAIKNNIYTHYWENGGRASTKSSMISVEIILDIIKDPNASAICYRKYTNNLRDSCFNQLLWAIEKLGVKQYFKTTVNPLKITYYTGQAIYFKGLDDPEKSKSIKPSHGYFKDIWLEELSEYAGMPEVRSILQSTMRGGEKYNVFYSYNPPININNWVNIECNIPQADKHVHSSTYLEVPLEWLGEQFFIEAEHLKSINEQAYRHEYLGEATGTGLNVFTNLEIRQISDDEIKNFDNLREGIDWGFATSPFAWLKSHYDYKYRKLYLFDEIERLACSNHSAMEALKGRHNSSIEIIADSAEPKSINEFWDNGFLIKGATKGAGSISYGIKWLRGLDKIIIDPARCPSATKEFQEYEFKKNKDGSIRDDFPDENDHLIDCARYSLENDMPVNKGF